MDRSVRGKQSTSSSRQRFSDAPPITIYKTNGEVISVPGYPVVTDCAAPSRPRLTSKAGIVLALLETPEGATLAKLMEVTGWQAHTTRAALTGLRKRGFPVCVATEPGTDGRRVPIYRVAALDCAMMAREKDRTQPAGLPRLSGPA
jgi:hypothetical protein